MAEAAAILRVDALRKSFGALAREASQRVLREVAWHRNSCEQMHV